MTANDILRQLKQYGSPGIKHILMRHGAREPLFGVKVADLKKIQKVVKVNQPLALELFDTGNYDAMYLAGLIADDARMTRKDLQRWAERAHAGISEYTVPWVASQGPHGYAMGRKWIASRKEHVAAAGWQTLSCVTALTPDDQLDIPELSSLLDQVRATIHAAPERVRRSMHAFITSVGGYVRPLTSKALTTAKAVGAVTVGADSRACTLTPAHEMIERMKKRGVLGKKRAAVKC